MSSDEIVTTSSMHVLKLDSVDVPCVSLLKCDILQPKYDGWFAEGVIKGEYLHLYSATSKPLVALPLYFNPGPGIVRGEYMYGTNRALNDPSTYLTYRLYDVRLDHMQYYDRYKLLVKFASAYQEACLDHKAEQKIFLTPNYGTEFFSYLFEEVKNGKLEGIVGRNFEDSTYEKIRRYKPFFSTDYIALRLEEGKGKYEGTTGSIVGAQFKNGELVPICSVAGMLDSLRDDMWTNPSKYIGKVFEAVGSQMFDSGAMRHPRFRRWRLDVDPTTVIWKGKEGGKFVE